MLCVFGLVWTEGIAGLWPAVPVAVAVGAFLAVTDRFGRPEWPVGLLAPAALGVGLGIVASQLYLRGARPTVERPA